MSDSIETPCRFSRETIGAELAKLLSTELSDSAKDELAQDMALALRNHKMLLTGLSADAVKYLVKVIGLVEANKSWAQTYVGLYWLSLLVLVPFPLSRFSPTTPQRVVHIIDTSLDEPLLQFPTIRLLWAFYSRPDAVEHLDTLIKRLDITVLSNLMAMAALFKHCDRTTVQKYAVEVIDRVLASNDGKESELVFRTRVKLLSRAVFSLDFHQFNGRQQMLEKIVACLMEGLRWDDARVRWSSAKAMAQIGERVKGMIDVIRFVLEAVRKEWKENDGAWQGACLCVAEMTRRGLLDQNQLNDVISLSIEALAFDNQTAMHSVGGNVRDSGCFVAWSLARRCQMQPEQVRRLWPALICVAVFDRELNCRRAASAAIQELVGRTRNLILDHGIAVITLTEFASLSSLQHCYLVTAPQIAKLNKTLASEMSKHLVKLKLIHWDIEIRELAAETLGSVVLDEERTALVDGLFAQAQQPGNANIRHGAVLGLSQLIVSDDGQADKLIQWIVDKKLLRGLTGETLKQAVCCLIERIAKIKGTVTQVMINILWLSIQKEKAPDVVLAILESGKIDLLQDIINEFLKKEEIGCVKVLKKCANFLTIDQMKEIGSKIEKIMSVKNDQAELRSEVVSLLCQLINESSNDQILYSLMQRVLMSGLNDHFKNERGDLGAAVRTSVCEAIERLQGKGIFNQQMMVVLVKECFSPILRVRKAACRAFLAVKNEVGIVLDADSEHCRDDNNVFLQLIHRPEFTHSLWTAIVPVLNEIKPRLKQELKNCDRQVIVRFCDLLRRNSSHSLLETAIFLIAECGFNDQQLISESFVCCQRASRHKTDANRIKSAATLLRVLVSLDCQMSFKELVGLLKHDWPKVRSHVAAELYLCVDDDEALLILEQTDWVFGEEETRNSKVESLKKILNCE